MAQTDPVMADGLSPSERATSRKNAIGVLIFTARRLAFSVLVLLFVAFASYLGLDMAAGTGLVPALARALPKTLSYVGRLVRGDLGATTAGSDTWAQRRVGEVIVERLPRSLGLLFLSLLFAGCIGVLLGIVAARGRSRRSLGIILATLIGVSVPSFFANFLLQWAVTTYTRQVGRAVLPVGGFGWDKHLILPVLVLSARPIAQITRITFIAVREVLDQDYVRTAHGKGLRRLRVLSVHVLRNAAIPILTTIGVSLRFSLSSLPVVEYYFSWPGAGFTLLKGIAQQDANLTVALTLCLGLLFLLVNLALELSYRLIDPRLLQTAPHIVVGGRQTLWSTLKSAWESFLGLLLDNAFVHWLRRRRKPPELAPLSTAPLSAAPSAYQDADLAQARRRSAWLPVFTNIPLIVGGMLLLSLLVIVFLGPRLAPNSPYHTQSLAMVEGKLTAPPFAPGAEYPWGTDVLGRGMMALVLAGSQQTLILAILAVTARVLVGVLFGAVAGWTQGSVLDRLILGLAEVVASFPTLLLAMILVLGLGIRRGMPPFVIALCFVGWGEIMQFVRSQVAAIRPRPYIENAVAIGARTPRILAVHVLPHLFSALTSIVALEMGAVLSLLGELGFISIFIGGGIVAAPTPGRRILYSDVPEWGALLSDLRYQARSYPWTALYPMLAFFVAILSFNLFGEGIRRLLENGSLIYNRLLNRYVLLTIVIGAAGFGWLASHSGSTAFYQQHARTFDGQTAFAHVEALTAPSMEGRALGSPGMDLAADYVAESFKSLGLQAVGQEGSFFQQRQHAFLRLDSVPTLTIEDGGAPLAYGSDYAVFPGPDAAGGQGRGPLRVVGLGQQGLVVHGAWRVTYPDLERADFSGQVVLVMSAREAELLIWKPKAALLVVAEDPAQLQQRLTLGGRQVSVRTHFPSLWISEATANRLLVGSSYTVAQFREAIAELPMERVFELPLPSVQVGAAAEGTVEKKWPVRHVLGYLPGTHSYDFCFDCLGKRLIVVLARYDSPPLGPDGVIYPAADDNASGVAVMLEAIRVLQETDYEPYKTFLFVAYSGEGLEGGEPVSNPDVKRFLQARAGLSQHELEAVVQLRALGGKDGRRLLVSASGSLRLAQLFERSARQMGVDVARANETIDIGMIYDQSTSFHEGGQDVPVVRLYRDGWTKHARLPEDTIEAISAASLRQAGRALALALMVLGRETNY